MRGIAVCVLIGLFCATGVAVYYHLPRPKTEKASVPAKRPSPAEAPRPLVIGEIDSDEIEVLDEVYRRVGAPVPGGADPAALKALEDKIGFRLARFHPPEGYALERAVRVHEEPYRPMAHRVYRSAGGILSVFEGREDPPATASRQAAQVNRRNGEPVNVAYRIEGGRVVVLMSGEIPAERLLEIIAAMLF